MAKEIERRWLLPALPAPAALGPAHRIEQGYLERSSPLESLRVRIVDGAFAVITGKTGLGMEREEREHPVSLDAARMLMDFSDHRLEKSRHVVGGFEVDVFHGPLTGIVLAEMESPDRALVLSAVPEGWMGPGVVEVTDSLTNLHLARMASDLRDTGTDPLQAILERAGGRRIPRIVITGGPGSGKSTMMEVLRREYPDLQFVPEVATIVIAQVGIVPGSDPVSWRQFQRTVWRVQKIFETTSAEAAVAARKRAIVLDRGSMDSAAYLANGVAELEAMFRTTAAAEYANYSAVLELDVPPRGVYEAIRGNNPARSETYDEAAAIGKRIGYAWRPHPRYAFIGSDSWEGKVSAVRRELDRLLQ